MSRFEKWSRPLFEANGMTKWGWMCQYHENLELAENTDIGAFTYINAKHGVSIGRFAEIGSHCSIYSWSTIDDKMGRVVIGESAKIGSHSVVMPGVTIGEKAVVGAFSFVNKDVPAGMLAYGIPVRVVRKL